MSECVLSLKWEYRYWTQRQSIPLRKENRFGSLQNSSKSHVCPQERFFTIQTCLVWSTLRHHEIYFCRKSSTLCICRFWNKRLKNHYCYKLIKAMFGAELVRTIVPAPTHIPSADSSMYRSSLAPNVQLLLVLTLVSSGTSYLVAERSCPDLSFHSLCYRYPLF